MSKPHAHAVVIAIGDELVGGQCVDTNSAYLADRLGEAGIRTVEHCTIGDELPAIVEAFRRAAGTADLIVATGGLGPTEDDLTRDALAQAMGVDLTLCSECLADLEAFFHERGRPISQANRRQAMLPVGAEGLVNAVGTAPGIVATLDSAAVFCLPGVPHEMRTMYDQQVASRLGAGGNVIIHHAVHTFGAPESEIGATLADLMTPDAYPRLGTTAKIGVISVRFSVSDTTIEGAQAQVRQTSDVIGERLGEIVFGEGEETLASAVGDLLKKRGQTLATAESCTGGLLGETITAVSGASAYYLGGVVAYADPAKQQFLDVPANVLASCGAVSEPVAAAMAEGCRRRFNSDWALSVTGIAGPTGGTADKPVGLVYLAVAGPDGTEVHRHHITGPRPFVRQRATWIVLNDLRIALMKA